MADAAALKPARAIADANPVRWPNESAAYRTSRNNLLAAEIELRRLNEAVAVQRRQLPPGGAVIGDYSFAGEQGQTDLGGLFGDKDTLVVYAYMFGPQRERPCPMCTNVLSSWDGIAPDVEQRVAFAVTARAPLDALLAFKRERGWQHLPLYSDLTGDFSRDYRAVSPDGDDIPQFLVFIRHDGTIRLSWAGEMGMDSADPGQDPRGAPDISPLWTILDMTPAGRGADWYPKLAY
jgi:predicted dithiol-disulfide oxidoreductase (DUF899 family)